MMSTAFLPLISFSKSHSLPCCFDPVSDFISHSFFHLSLHVYTSSSSGFLNLSPLSVSLSLQVSTTSTYHYTLTWRQLPRPWPHLSLVWRSGTACGSKSPSPTLSSVRQKTSGNKGRKKEFHELSVPRRILQGSHYVHRIKTV